MGLPTGAEGRDSKGEDSAEEMDTKPALLMPPPMMEALSAHSSLFCDPTAEVSLWWALECQTGGIRQPHVL